MYLLLVNVDHQQDELLPMVEVENQLPMRVKLDYRSKNKSTQQKMIITISKYQNIFFLLNLVFRLH